MLPIREEPEFTRRELEEEFKPGPSPSRHLPAPARQTRSLATRRGNTGSAGTRSPKASEQETLHACAQDMVCRVGVQQLRMLRARGQRNHEFVRALALSLASENASRLAAMEIADRNIDERQNALIADFRHCREEAITSELLDLVTAFEALTNEPAEKGAGSK